MTLAPSRGYVLIVEDDVTIRDALVAIIRDENGTDVKVAGHGRDALDLALEAPPRLILLDMMMPVMDGLEFLREKNARPALAAIPVCIMTAGRGRGVDLPSVCAFLQKPFDLGALLAIVDRYCPVAEVDLLDELEADAAADDVRGEEAGAIGDDALAVPPRRKAVMT